MEFYLQKIELGNKLWYCRARGTFTPAIHLRTALDLHTANELSIQLNARIIDSISLDRKLGPGIGKLDSRPSVYCVFNNQFARGKLCRDGSVELWKNFRVKCRWTTGKKLGSLEIAFLDCKPIKPTAIKPDQISVQSPYRASLVGELNANPILPTKPDAQIEYKKLSFSQSHRSHCYTVVITDGIRQHTIQHNAKLATFKINGDSMDFETMRREYGDTFRRYVFLIVQTYNAVLKSRGIKVNTI